MLALFLYLPPYGQSERVESTGSPALPKGKPTFRKRQILPLPPRPPLTFAVFRPDKPKVGPFSALHRIVQQRPLMVGFFGVSDASSDAVSDYRRWPLAWVNSLCRRAHLSLLGLRPTGLCSTMYTDTDIYMYAVLRRCYRGSENRLDVFFLIGRSASKDIRPCCLICLRTRLL